MFSYYYNQHPFKDSLILMSFNKDLAWVLAVHRNNETRLLLGLGSPHTQSLGRSQVVGFVVFWHPLNCFAQVVKCHSCLRDISLPVIRRKNKAREDLKFKAFFETS